MTKKECYSFVINYFLEHAPNAETELLYKDPFELLVAVILSAQCTDKRVNIVTKDLFKKYKTFEDYANADTKEFESIIKPCGFYHAKTKALINGAKTIVSEHNSSLPNTLNGLVHPYNSSGCEYLSNRVVGLYLDI